MKKLFILMTALLLAFGAAAQNPSHIERYAEANAQLSAPTGPRVVLFGDSITDGWPQQRPEFFAATGFIGRGIGGEETSHMVLRFRQDVIDIQASTVVILAGPDGKVRDGLTTDTVHPNAAGYALMEKLLLETLK